MILRPFIINEIQTNILVYYDKDKTQRIPIDKEDNIFLHDALLNTFSFLGITKNENDIYFLIDKYRYHRVGYISFTEFFNIIKNEIVKYIDQKEFNNIDNYLFNKEKVKLIEELDNYYLSLKHKTITPMEYQKFKQELSNINYDISLFFKEYII